MNRLHTPGFLPAALALFLVVGAVRPASAHALGAECKLQGDRVEVEAYYDDDTPARDAQVVVQDAAGKHVAEGRTNDKGMWSFARPDPGRYRVTVDAGAGHRATVTMTVPKAPPDAATRAHASNDACDCCPDDASANGEQAAVRLSEGPGRAEFTRMSWWKIFVGLGAIGGLSLVARWVMRRGRCPSPGAR
jgi:hypothetical protein